MPFRIDPAELPARVQRLSDIVDLSSLLGAGEGVWLVGGALRDLLLGHPVADIDLAVQGDPTRLARAFAHKTGGHWFYLDEERRQSRVAIADESGHRTCDFAPLRAGDLEGDLRLRDFTVNALAVPLHFSGAGKIVDPIGALDDLAGGILRGGSAGVFDDDPLRVLKGVRHAAIFGFAVENGTAEHMRQAAPAVAAVPPERIRGELGKIFAAVPIASPLRLMRSLGLSEPLFGAAAGESWEKGIRLAVRCEQILQALGPEEGLLAEEVEAGLTRASLLKLAALGRGFPPSEMNAWSPRFKLGRRAAAILSSLSSLDPVRAQEMDGVPPGRPRALWGAGLGRHPVETLVLIATYRPGTPSAVAEILRLFLHDFLFHAEDGRVPDLVDGRWIRDRLGLPPGPAVGRALVALRGEEIAGRVGSQEEGRKFLESFVKK